ncbi:MAG: hypothetical protein JWM74_1334 [Myxococcaceae bacterium]|nr:hypothetical protein [Myxococcaceae bacterium]
MSAAKHLRAWGWKVLLAGAFLVTTPLAGMSLASTSEAQDRRAAATITVKDDARVEGVADAASFVGVLLPPQMANLSQRADGKVLEVKVRLGERVEKGAVLLVFDPRERQHDLAMVEAQLRVAKADAAGASSELGAARKRAARRNATVDVGGRRIALVSGEEAAQAKSEADGAAARAASAGAHIAEIKARVDQLRLALEETEVRAPFAGVVTSIAFEPGASVRAGDTVARLVGGDGLRVRIAVPEESVAVLRSGHARARMVVDGRTLFADIDQVSPEVEPASRAFVVEGRVLLDEAMCRASNDCATLAGRVVRASL